MGAQTDYQSRPASEGGDALRLNEATILAFGVSCWAFGFQRPNGERQTANTKRPKAEWQMANSIWQMANGESRIFLLAAVRHDA